MSEQKYPEPIIGALIFNQEDKVFLMTSPKWKGKYVVPGGHIELGETIEEAIKREIKEETNLDIFNIQFITLQEFIFGEDFHQKKHFLFLDYACETKDTDVVLNKEGSGYVWVTIEEALELPIEPYTKAAILKYKEKFLEENILLKRSI
ncbi:NUDIX domain-containing protein [Patescibacteria group bacterium]|nr:NUDIX domain-containing protein [Patescibacteria group bacterium]